MPAHVSTWTPPEASVPTPLVHRSIWLGLAQVRTGSNPPPPPPQPPHLPPSPLFTQEELIIFPRHHFQKKKNQQSATVTVTRLPVEATLPYPPHSPSHTISSSTQYNYPQVLQENAQHSHAVVTVNAWQPVRRGGSRREKGPSWGISLGFCKNLQRMCRDKTTVVTLMPIMTKTHVP